MTVIDWLRLFASIYILAIPLMWRGVAIDEAIAVGIAMVAMSGRAGFEMVTKLVEVYRYLQAHELAVVAGVTIFLTGWTIAGVVLTARAWSDGRA